MAAPRNSRVLTVHPQLHNDQNDDRIEQAEDEKESMFRKISVWFRRKPSPGDLKQIRDIPGKGFQFVNLLLLRKYGLEALTRKIEQYESRVFRFNGGVKEVFLCDWRSGQEFFAEGKVNRELKISTVSFNTAIADGYVSVSMSNGISHANKKSFLMSLARSAETEFLLPALQELIPQHLKSWNVVPTIKDEIDLENSIFLLVDDIISEVFFGTWLNFDALQIWRSALFRKNNPKAAYQKCALDAFDVLYNAVVNCPKAKEILVEGRAYGLNYDEAMKEALYAAVLNSVALSFTITSLVGRLSQLSMSDLKEMKEEVTECADKTLSRESLRRLKKVENFILEVLRMHPPLPVLHGRARFDLLVESSSALYAVKKDERLACSIYQIQRDPHLFSNPSQFLPNRFENKRCKQSLVAFGGNHSDTPKAQTHHCCGQEISMTVLKVLMIHLLFCKLELKEQPKWSTNSRSRFGRPSKRLELELFAYREPTYKSSGVMEVIDWDEKMVESENDDFDVDP